MLERLQRRTFTPADRLKKNVDLEACALHDAGHYWQRNSSRWNDSWVDDRTRPEKAGGAHPSSKRHPVASPYSSDPLGDEDLCKE
eukprot:5595667-Pleurochrysis_carterae.AAC.1